MYLDDLCLVAGTQMHIVSIISTKKPCSLHTQLPHGRFVEQKVNVYYRKCHLWLLLRVSRLADIGLDRHCPQSCQNREKEDIN